MFANISPLRQQSLYEFKGFLSCSPRALLPSPSYLFTCTDLIRPRPTPGRGLTEEFDEAAVTVRLVVLLFERAFVELLQAEGADEVFRVELLGHGGDAAARDGLLAARAQ